MKYIAETAWHHEGDFGYQKDLVSALCESDTVDIVKLHVTIDFDSYMDKTHPNYSMQKKWLLTESQWVDVVNIVDSSSKGLMLLVNDKKAIDFATNYNVDLIELHSVLLNVFTMQEIINQKIDTLTKVAIGVGGSSIEEIDAAIDSYPHHEKILFFGIQNYPTVKENINLNKIKKIQDIYKKLDFAYADHSSWDDPDNIFITSSIGTHGFSYIEKHITLNKGIKRCDFDSAISLEDFKKIKQNIDKIELAFGDGKFELNQGEKKYREKGLMKLAPIYSKNMKAGDLLDRGSIDFIRTAKKTNIEQLQIFDFFGRKLKRDVIYNEPINYEDFE